MPKLKLTSQAVKGLSIPTHGRVDYQDSTLPGLVLRVSSTGAKSYSVSWWKDGARPRVTLGVDESSPVRGPAANVERLSLADARDKAKEVLRGVRAGADPAKEKRQRRQGTTFSELAREYILRWARSRKRAKGAREDELRIERVLIPRWGSWKAADVQKRDVVALLDEIADSGRPIARNRMQSLVSKVFNFGIRRDVVEHNPALGIDREPERVRTRVLSDDELRVLLPLFKDEGLAGLGFRLLLLTGQRPVEVFGARWSEVDGDVWTVPAERSKNKRPSAVPLSAQARTVLQELRGFDVGTGYLFPSRVGRPGGKAKRAPAPFVTYAKALNRVRARARLAQDWILYDLKSTCMTGLERLGVPAPVVSAVANHAPQGVTRQHYSFHDFLEEKRAALQKWGDHVEKIDPATREKVAQIRRRR